MTTTCRFIIISIVILSCPLIVLGGQTETTYSNMQPMSKQAVSPEQAFEIFDKVIKIQREFEIQSDINLPELLLKLEIRKLGEEIFDLPKLYESDESKDRYYNRMIFGELLAYYGYRGHLLNFKTNHDWLVATKGVLEMRKEEEERENNLTKTNSDTKNDT